MLNKMILLGLLVAAPLAGARAADPAPAPQQSGTGGMWIFLKSSVPSAATACPDAQAAGSGLVKVPLFSEKSGSCPVATIQDGPSVTVDDLATALAGAHGAYGKEQQAGKQDPTAIVNRLVDAKLVALEGEAMGIDELPEVKEGIKAAQENVGREMLKEQVLRDVRSDPAEVDRLFKQKVQEWKLQSVLFAREDDAKAMAKQLKAGKKFDELATKAVADKKAKGNEPGQFVHGSKLIATVLANVEKTPVGKTTPPVKIPGGYTVIEVEEIRYPENPKARAEAEATSLLEQKKRALKRYYDDLVKKYVKIDEKLLKKLDFEAKKPGIDAMKKDTRVLATVQGQPPVTVGLLTTALAEQFFHGVDNATQKKRLTKAKGTTLDALISVRVVADEVERLGHPQDRRVPAAPGGLHGEPGLRGLRAKGGPPRREARRGRRSASTTRSTGRTTRSPPSTRWRASASPRQKDAEAAVAKLRGGTDFKWLNANADGKLPPGKDSESPNGVLSAKGMTPAFAKVMEGARSGEYRVFVASPEQSYAIHVIQVTPATAQPYEDVRASLTQKLYGEAVQKSIEDWIAKLRKAHPVQVYLARVGS